MPSSVEFNAGDTEQEVTFQASPDDVDDDGESVKLGFGNLPARVSAGGTAETTVSITDDDVPSVTVSFEQSSYTVIEGDSVAVKVQLSADPERRVTIVLTKTNEGGASASDYSVPANVVFDSGETEKMFNFSATQDAVDDDSESVKLSFGNLPAGVSAGSRNESTVSITDDDSAGVTVSDTSLDLDEGDSDTYTVILDSKPTHNVTITVNDPSNTDVTADPADLTFTPTNWDTAQTVTVTASQDSGHDDEDGTVTHTAASTDAKYDGISVSDVSVNVTDDEDVPVTVSFEEGTYSVIEGESVIVTVVLDVDPERTVEVSITATNQDDASADDYSVPTSVVFTSGETEQTIEFEATDDDEDDNDESVKLTFGGLPTAVSQGTTNQTVVSIVDNDGGGEGDNKGVPVGDLVQVAVSFEQASYAVAEGHSTTVKVTLDQDPERTVAIPLTKTDQGGAGSADYAPVPTSIEFVSGETEKTFSFSATQDTTDDDGESVALEFGDLPDGVTEGTISETTISITDDDETIQNLVSVQVSFQASTYALTEGGTTSVTVTLSADPERNVSIPLTTTNGTGTTSGDYSGVPASLDFASGDTQKSFIFTAEQDDIDEEAEELTLGFDTLPDGVSSGTTAQAVVTILDSIHVSFDASYYEAYEGGNGAVVTVQLDSAPAVDTVIPLTATGMDGAVSADWTGVPSSVTFAAGDTQETFTLMAYDDQVEDDGESVELGFGNLPAGVARGTPSVATVELMNMEVPTCETALWCADVEFADAGSKDWKRPGLGLGYHTTQEPYLRYASLSDDRFTFRGKEYQVWSMFTTPGTHPGVVPGSPGRIPEYSTFSVYLMEVVGGERKLRVDRDHQRDWTLYIDGIALPFTDALVGNQSGNRFIWHHPALQDLFANWTDGDIYEVMIVEDPVSERPEPPVTAPTAPRYLRVIPGNGSLVAVWKEPFKNGNAEVTHYRLQWKPATEGWGNPNAVEETTVPNSGGGSTEVFHQITGLSDYTRYTLRVIAVNAMGDSQPSVEHFGMPQEQSLDIADTVVNGNQLTITYERTLDGGSVPLAESFRVLVNGAPRNVTGVSVSGRSVVLTLEEPAKRAIRATDEVEFLYLMPPSGAPAIKDTAGNYANTCDFGEPPSEARNETDPGLLEPVSAEFTMVPASHSGPGSEIVFRIEFSEPVRVDIGRTHVHLLDVEGGKVISAWWLDGDTTVWEVVVEPVSHDDINITLPAGRACDAQGAPCGSGDRRLSNQPGGVIPGSGSGEGGSNTRALGRAVQLTNTPATGTPAVSGSPVVGRTLTATTSGIADDDGLATAVFAYQWLADEAAIVGATLSTYHVAPGDQGKELRVSVSFTDDAGNKESLTSVATAPVAAALAPLTASLENGPAGHDGQAAFTFELRLSEHIEGLRYVTLRDHAFMVVGGQVKKAQRMDRESETRNIHWRITVKPDGDGDVVIVLPVTTDCGAQGAICTADGRKLSGRLELRVSGPSG